MLQISCIIQLQPPSLQTMQPKSVLQLLTICFKSISSKYLLQIDFGNLKLIPALLSDCFTCKASRISTIFSFYQISGCLTKLLCICRPHLKFLTSHNVPEHLPLFLCEIGHIHCCQQSNLFHPSDS